MSNGRQPTRRVVGVLGALMVAGVAVWVGANLWLDSGDAPEEFSSSDDFGSAEAPTTTGLADAARSDSGPAWGGTWVVALDPSSDGGVGYRILEDVPLVGQEVVAARTADVSGQITLDQGGLKAAELVIALDTLISDNTFRDGIVASDYLESDDFPTATIAVTGPVALDVASEPATVARTSFPADLTLHGQTEAVTVTADAQWSADAIEIVGTVDITLDQFGITRPDLLGRSARNEAVIEFKLHFERA